MFHLASLRQIDRDKQNGSELQIWGAAIFLCTNTGKFYIKPYEENGIFILDGKV